MRDNEDLRRASDGAGRTDLRPAAPRSKLWRAVALGGAMLMRPTRDCSRRIIGYNLVEEINFKLADLLGKHALLGVDGQTCVCADVSKHSARCGCHGGAAPVRGSKLSATVA